MFSRVPTQPHTNGKEISHCVFFPCSDERRLFVRRSLQEDVVCWQTAIPALSIPIQCFLFRYSICVMCLRLVDSPFASNSYPKSARCSTLDQECVVSRLLLLPLLLSHSAVLRSQHLFRPQVSTWTAPKLCQSLPMCLMHYADGRVSL